MYFLSVGSDIVFATLDIIRDIGITIIDIIYNTIDVLYDVAQKVNSLNLISMLENIPDSPFVKIFNAFFILSFSVLFLFSIWKITFKILDGDSQDNSLFELIKEIVKCGVLIFCTYLIFNTGINLGLNLSNAIYNNFTHESSTIGSTMKTAYLDINDKCYQQDGGEATDASNVDNVKSILTGEVEPNILDKITTMDDLQPLIRNGNITASNIIDSDAFNLTCSIHNPGIWNDEEEYVFSYNFMFGIIVGAVFLFAIGFAVLMLGKRQLEIAFLMTIAPLVFATSVSRKEQRQALYQQFASLVLQAGALMLLIGLTSIMFTAIQNSNDINELSFFTKLVLQSILYLGCAMMLLTGSTALNRFIGENVSANSGRDLLMAMGGLRSGMMAAGSMASGGFNLAKNSIIGGARTTKGLGELAKGSVQTTKGMYQGIASIHPNLNSRIADKMSAKGKKAITDVARGNMLQQSNNALEKAYGKYLESRGEGLANKLTGQWDFENNRYNPDYIKNGVDLARQGIGNIVGGFNTVRGVNNVGNSKKTIKPKINNYGNETDKI